MARIKCPRCKEKMDLRAEVCPNCRSTFTPEEIAKRVSDSHKAGAAGCLTLVLIVGACSWLGAAPEEPGPTARADAIAFYHNVLDVIGPCDQAGSLVADAAAMGDLVRLYQAADAMEGVCLKTSSAIRDVEIPKTVGRKAHEQLGEAVKRCDSAYTSKWSAAGMMKEALEDMGSIARQAEMTDAAEMLQAATLVCASHLVTVPMSFGATSADLGLADRKE